jgi:hypothetical protein
MFLQDLQITAELKSRNGDAEETTVYQFKIIIY